MAVGFEVGVVVHGLITIEEAELILFVDFIVSTDQETHLFQFPSVECLGTDIGSDGKSLGLVFRHQAASEHVLALSIVDVLLAVPSLLVVTPALVDRIFRPIGVLPPFTQRQLHLSYLVTACEGDIETMPCPPVLSALLGVAYIDDASLHLSIITVEIRDAFVVVIQEGVSCCHLELREEFVTSTDGCRPSVYGLHIVAGAHLHLRTY